MATWPAPVGSPPSRDQASNPDALIAFMSVTFDLYWVLDGRANSCGTSRCPLHVQTARLAETRVIAAWLSPHTAWMRGDRAAGAYLCRQRVSLCRRDETPATQPTRTLSACSQTSKRTWAKRAQHCMMPTKACELRMSIPSRSILAYTRVQLARVFTVVGDARPAR